jgi:hypothetical protein
VYTFFLKALWILEPILACVAIGIFLQRKHHKKFPFFLVYLVVKVVDFCVMYPIYFWASEKFYDRYGWTIDAISTVIAVGLAFKVLHEVFFDVFRPFHTLRDLGTIIFRWVGLVTVLVSIVVAASTPADTSPMREALIALQRCLRMSQVGLVLFLLVFATYLGIRRRDLSFGISAGFGLFAFWELVTWALLFGGHRPTEFYEHAIVLSTLSIYNVSLVCWCVYATQKAKVRLSDSTTLQSQRWERSLTEVQHPVGDGALIPMFESMVEQALNRAKVDRRASTEDPAGPRAEQTRKMGAGQ